MAAGFGSFLDLLDPEDRARYGPSVASLGSDADVYPALAPRSGPRTAADEAAEAKRPISDLVFESLRTARFTGTTEVILPEVHRAELLRHVLKRAHADLVALRWTNGNPFVEYLTKKGLRAAGYGALADRTERLMDLTKIEQRILGTSKDPAEYPQYTSEAEFEADVRLMVSNATSFYGAGHAIRAAAEDLLAHFETQTKELMRRERALREYAMKAELARELRAAVKSAEAVPSRDT